MPKIVDIKNKLAKGINDKLIGTQENENLYIMQLENLKCSFFQGMAIRGYFRFTRKKYVRRVNEDKTEPNVNYFGLPDQGESAWARGIMADTPHSSSCGACVMIVIK